MSEPTTTEPTDEEIEEPKVISANVAHVFAQTVGASISAIAGVPMQHRTVEGFLYSLRIAGDDTAKEAAEAGWSEQQLLHYHALLSFVPETVQKIALSMAMAASEREH